MSEDSKALTRLKDSLGHGNLWLHIIMAIRDSGKEYAYNLPDVIEKTCGFRPNRVMIYVVLYKLEAERLIASEFVERRKYYTLTQKGKDELKRAKEFMASLSKRM